MQALHNQYRLEQYKTSNGEQHMCLVMTNTEVDTMPHFPTFKAESVDTTLADQKIMNEEVCLRLDAYGQQYRFYVGDNETNLAQFGPDCDGVSINPDLVSGVGSLGCTAIGMFASANGESSNNMATFTEFSYRVTTEDPRRG